MLVFLDGAAGTTGLRIEGRLQGREDMTLLTLTGEERKNAEKRRQALNDCDIAILCLPDDAAREAVSMVENPKVRVIDASTAHRTAPGWAYGFPELAGDFRHKIETGSRVAVTGCHASGFLALVQPLQAAGVLKDSGHLMCHSITGYSGGGKKMIAQYEESGRSVLLDAPRQYGLSQTHKHLPEMQAIAKLAGPPIFTPIVADFYSGMCVTVPLFADQLTCSVEDVKTIYKGLYTGPVVTYQDAPDEGGFLAANALTGKDSMVVSVLGNEERLLLTAVFDNLGKGASGAAVQCLNLMTGQDETKGLVL